MTRWTRRLLRWAVAAAAGAGMGLALAPHNLWPLAIVGVAAVTLLARHGRAAGAAGAGYAFGLGLGVVSVSWVGVLGWWVAALLVLAMAVWPLLVGLVTRWIRDVPGSLWWTSALWVASEYGQSHVPFGGFPWIRLAWTTLDEPVSGWLPVLGAVGTSWLTALVAMALVALVEPAGRGLVTPRRVTAVVVVAAVFAGGAALAARPVQTPASDPTVTLGVVQGDVTGTSGPQAMGYARSVTNNHLSETITLMARARTGLDPMPDLVVWPENSTDVDPTKDAETNELVMTASKLSQRPMLIGAVMDGPGVDERQTSALWWTTAGTVAARYDKRNLVPFGEFIPMRSLLLPIIPILQEVGAQAIPGHGPGVLTGAIDGRTVSVGTIICFELAWDSTVADTVRHGAQVIAVQSNNGTYTGTGQPTQQFAITRARAMELRREIVVTTTNAFSGLIDARGHVVEASGPEGSWARSITVPLRSGVTLGVRMDPWLDRLSVLATVLALAGALVCARGWRVGGRRRAG